MNRSKFLDEVQLITQAFKALDYRGSWYSDHQSGLVRFSKEAKLYLPFTQRELSDFLPLARFDELLHADDRAWLQERRNVPSAVTKTRSVLQFRVIGRDGERWIQSHSQRIMKPDGTPVSSHGMSFDITDFVKSGDSVARNPKAPLHAPLNHLAENLVHSLVAARQIGLPEMEATLEGMLLEVGRMLAMNAYAPEQYAVH